MEDFNLRDYISTNWLKSTNSYSKTQLGSLSSNKEEVQDRVRQNGTLRGGGESVCKDS